MSAEKLSEFRALIFADVSLQAKLREIIDRQGFIKAVTEMAREGGYEFTASEVEEALREGRRVWIERWFG